MAHVPPEREPVDRHEDVRIVEEPGFEQREHVVRDYAADRRIMLDRVTAFIWLMGGILIALLGMRFLLRLMGASPQAGFSNFVYMITEPFMWPFFGLTGTPGANGMVLEFPTLVAMLVYLFLTWVVVKVIWLVLDPATADRRTVRRYERDRLP
jgi:YggT family protein